MSLSEQARELAGKIDKATPGPWEYRKWHDAIDVLEGESANYYRICRYILDDDVNGEAICLARNEAPALLRQLADENERLRRAGKIMATAIWYRHDTPEATMTANEFLNDPATKEAR